MDGRQHACRLGGHRKRLLEPNRALVIDLVKAVPEITLKALVAQLAEQGITTSTVSVWRLVRSEGLRFKKTLFAVEQLRPKIARRSEQWKKYQEALKEALARYGNPEIFTTDQGSQFTGQAFTGVLLREKIAISTWTAGAHGATISSSSACGVRSNTRKSIYMPIAPSARHGARSVAI